MRRLLDKHAVPLLLVDVSAGAQGPWPVLRHNTAAGKLISELDGISTSASHAARLDAQVLLGRHATGAPVVWSLHGEHMAQRRDFSVKRVCLVPAHGSAKVADLRFRRAAVGHMRVTAANVEGCGGGAT